MSSQLDMFPGGSAPFVPGSATSRTAARRIAHELGRLEAEVFASICQSADRGRTDDEIERMCGMRHQTASARRRGLVLRGMVEDSGRTRLTRSKRPATVWVVKSETIQPMPPTPVKPAAPSRTEIHEALVELAATGPTPGPARWISCTKKTAATLTWLLKHYAP